MKKMFKVKDQFRIHPLSEVPGGYDLLIEEGHQKKHYDKIKNVWSYISAIKKSNRKNVRVWSADKEGNPIDLLWHSNLKIDNYEK